MKISDIVEEGYGRSTNIFRDFFKDITNLPNVDKLVADRSTSRGHAFMVRGKDGNAYEIQIHPVSYGDYFQEERKASQHKMRKDKERTNRSNDNNVFEAFLSSKDNIPSIGDTVTDIKHSNLYGDVGVDITYSSGGTLYSHIS